jgi:hypothetical protein
MTTLAEGPSRELIAKIDELVQATESVIDPHARATATELVQAVMALHSAAIGRMLELISQSADGSESMASMVSDELVSSVLVLHGLHPDDAETRVRRAFEKLRRHFDSRGGRIELLEVDSQVVRMRLSGRAATPANKSLVEDAIVQAAPEIETVIVEGIQIQHDVNFVPLAELGAPQQV